MPPKSVLRLGARSDYVDLCEHRECTEVFSYFIAGNAWNGEIEVPSDYAGDIAERNSLVSDRDRVPRSGVRVTFDAGLIML